MGKNKGINEITYKENSVTLGNISKQKKGGNIKTVEFDFEDSEENLIIDNQTQNLTNVVIEKTDFHFEDENQDKEKYKLKFNNEVVSKNETESEKKNIECDENSKKPNNTINIISTIAANIEKSQELINPLSEQTISSFNEVLISPNENDCSAFLRSIT